MNKMKKTLLSIFVLLTFVTLFTINAKAATEVGITVNGTSLDVTVNPATFTSSEVTYDDVTNKAVIYTADWHFAKTNRTEAATDYVVVKNNGNFTITKKVSGNTEEIPLNGFILSVPASLGKDFSVNNTVNVGSLSIGTFNYALKSENGVRVAFNSVNESSVNNTATYYNYLYGSTTKTNSFSTNEIIVKFDSTKNSFAVSKVGGGNNNIPRDGFVLAYNGRPKSYMFADGVLFNGGEKVELVNMNFIEIENSFTKQFTKIGSTGTTRQQDNLVIYPAANNPSLSTGQNPYGYEVAVDSRGIVVQKGVLVPIPQGGFVISGHGVNDKFIQDNIQIGAKVIYNASTLTMTVSTNLIDQTMFNFETKKDTATSQVNTAYEGMYDVNDLETAQSNLATINEYFDLMLDLQSEIAEKNNPGDIIQFLEYKDVIEPLFEDVFFDTLVSKRIQTRGIWHRPYETSLSLIRETLDELKSMNFTDIYLETFWNGYTIYKSEYAPYHVLFSGANFGPYEDYLSAFIAEAKLRDINVQAWVENFFVGVSWQYSSLWDDYPEWRIKDINGGSVITGKGGDEEGFLFFDPANPETREFVLNIYREIVEFDFTGLQLDYIRYPSGNTNVQHSTGYTEYAMNEFKELYGVSGNVVQLVQSDSNIYNKWNEYRQMKINTFVETIHTEIRDLKPGIKLTIAVGPDAAYAKINLMQDWKTWVENGWIDAVLPMVYVNDVSLVVQRVEAAKKIMGIYANIMAGISPTYDGLPGIYNATYTDAINQNGAHGSAIFATHNYRRKADLIEIFQKGTYKNETVSLDKPVNDLYDMFIYDMLYKFDNIYVKRGVSTLEQRNLLASKLNQLAERKYINPIDYYELSEALDLLTLELVLYTSSDAAESRIKEDIAYFREILDIKISRYLINNRFWNPKEDKNRPDVYDFEYPVIEDNDDTDDVGDTNKTLLIVAISVVSVTVVGGGLFVGFKVVKKKKSKVQI